ncbi:CotH protein [Butyrivibrio fibrisolvens 16/4]|nr:CotH protein [Butyrivibrio fibrisolvens 16/4]
MRKIGWNIFFTVIFCGVLLFCIHFEKQTSVTQADITDYLSFVIPDNSELNKEENVSFWRQDDNTCIVFLPSYAELSKVKISVNMPESIFIDGIPLTDGMLCDSYELEKDYNFKIGDYPPMKLKFLQSENVSSMFITTSHDALFKVNEDKSLKERINISIRESNGNLDYATHSYDDQIRGHGNSTWKYNKKAYNIYLDKANSLLNMNRSKDWVLIANALDATNLRNKIIYDFINDVSVEEKIAPSCEYVELYVDGEYLGLYLLCEKIRDVADGYKGNRGYIEVCQNNAISKVDYPEAVINFKNNLFFEIVDSEKYSADLNEKLEKYLYETDKKLYGEDWYEYIDIHSFAVKYLIEEIFSNIDGTNASQYYYWDQNNKKLYTGVCWDYDLTMGDSTWVQWISPYNLYIQNGLWYKQIFDHQEFCDYYKELYKLEFLPVINHYLDEEIQKTYSEIEKASSNNFIRWKSTFEVDSDSPAEMISFLTKHVEFLNSVWVDGDNYCKVTFEGDNKLPIVDLYVPYNTPVNKLPNPSDVGLEGAEWLSGDDKPLDKNYLVTGNLVLHVEKTLDEAATKPIGTASREKHILASIMALLALFVCALYVDYRNNIQKGKLVNE